MRLFFALALGLFVSFGISCEKRNIPLTVEAQAEKEPIAIPTLEGKYKIAYDYLLEHRIKGKPQDWMSAIILKRVTNLGIAQSDLQVRYLFLTDDGKFVLVRDGTGLYGIDMDALFDIGDHIIFNGISYGQDIWGVCSGSFKIIKKEAVELQHPQVPTKQ